MERKPRPLQQPVLSRAQWARIIFLGLIMAVVTLYVEKAYEATSYALAITMAFAVFSLLNVAIGISARDEFHTAFNRDFLSDRRQLMLYGISLLLTFLATELGFLQRILGTTSLSRDQWFLAIGLAIALLLIDEAIKFILRRRNARAQPQVAEMKATPAPAAE